jgi:hypothetical protein
MKRLFVGTTVVAALWFAAPSWAQRAEAPLPPQPAAPPSVSQAGPPASQTAPYAQHPPPRIEMPAAQQQAGGEAAEPSPPPRYRAHRRRVMQAAQVNRSVANGFTAELNRRELESLGSGGGTPPAETAPPPWRDLYPPR